MRYINQQGSYLPMYKGRYKVSEYCQLLDKRNFPATKTENGVTWTNNGDGTITVDGTATGGSTYKLSDKILIKSNRKYLYCGIDNSTNVLLVYNLFYSDGSFYKSETINSSIIIDTASIEIGAIQCFAKRNNNIPTSGIVKPQLFDLTEIYGAGNEPTTVEQFRQDFPNDLYPYAPYCWVKMKQMRYITTTKNLFDIPLTQGYPSNNSWTNDTARTFTFGTYIIGITVSNYYIPSNVADVNISKNSIHFNIKGSYYGVAMPYYLTVGNTYTVSCKADNNFHPLIGISYYKEDGTFISFTQSEVITNNPVLSFTVPNDTYYTLILFSGRSGNEYTFSNIQLEEGSTATPYVPYGYLSLK